MRFVIISREQVVYFIYIYRQYINNFIVFSLASLKRYCFYIFEILSCVLIVAINVFINIEVYSFVVIL